MTDGTPLPAASTATLERTSVLQDGLAVLRAFDARHPAATAADLARRAGVEAGEAGRALDALADLGYVRRDDGVYSLTPRVLELGFGYLAASPLCDVAPPHLDDLSRTVAQSAAVSVLDGDQIVYIARSQSRRIRRVAITIGSRYPAWVTSMGRVLLAALPREQRDALLDGVDLQPVTPRTIVDRTRLDGELDRIARQGWALLDGELEIGLRSLAAPLHDRSGAVVAAVNVAMGGFDEPDRLLAPLLTAAAAIESGLAQR